MSNAINNLVNIFWQRLLSVSGKLPQLRYLFLVLAFLISNIAYANSILIVSEKDKSFSSSLTKLLEDKLNSSKRSFTIHNTTIDDYLDHKQNEHDLIITLGSIPAEKILQKETSTPVLNLLITSKTFRLIKELDNYSHPWSTLLIDQPFNRQFIFIKHLLGENKTIGTIFGPHSSKQKKHILSIAKRTNTKLIHQTTNITDQLISSLKNIIDKSDVLLAIPDPIAFNKNTIRGILLLTYRKNMPVIGFSKSYVKAGALAAIYSTPQQISDQAAEIILDFFKYDKRFRIAKHYPKDFDISINNKIAKTLNINIENKDILIKNIKAEEDSR